MLAYWLLLPLLTLHFCKFWVTLQAEEEDEREAGNDDVSNGDVSSADIVSGIIDTVIDGVVTTDDVQGRSRSHTVQLDLILYQVGRGHRQFSWGY